MRDALKTELKRAGCGPLVRANAAGCLDQCERGPVLVIYPQGIWYGGVRLEDLPRIVATTIIGGEILPDLLIPDADLNTRSAAKPSVSGTRPDACPPRDGPDATGKI